MSTLLLKIECDNAAFDWPHRNREIADVLQRLSIRMDVRDKGGSIRDCNGNRIGFWTFDEAEGDR